MGNKFSNFVVRWMFNSLGIWMAIELLGSGYDNADPGISLAGYLLAGLIFSIVNAILKPFIVIFSLPAILLTLGLFMLIVNGFMVYISLQIAPGIRMDFFNSILTGILLSLINYIVSTTLLLQPKRAN